MTTRITLLLTLTVHATTVTYDFDANSLSPHISDATATASDLTLQISANANNASQTHQVAQRSDEVGTNLVYYVNNRLFGTSGMSANETAALFTVSPATTKSLNFDTGTLSVDVSVFIDQGSTTNHVALYATTGGSTSQIGSTQTVSNNTPATSAALDVYEVGMSKTVSGWGLDPATTSVVTQTLNFDLSALGALPADQAITFTVAGLVDTVNTARFSSAFDNYTVTFIASDPPVYVAPTAVPEAYAVAPNLSLNIRAPGLLDNDLNPDDASLTAIKVSDPSHGTLALASDGSFIYTPATDYTGNDSFGYKLYDGTGDSKTTTVHLVVAEPSDVGLPNILIYYADDMGYGDTKVYNPSCPVDMPNLERFAEQGMRFTDAHTPQALCAPNRYSLLTGNYWDRSNKSWNINSNISSIKTSQESIADMLNKAGYQTAMIGKGHIGGNMPKLSTTVYGATNTHSLASANSGDEIVYDWTQRLADGACDHGFDYAFVAYGGLQDAPFLYLENDVLVGDSADVIHIDGQLNPDGFGKGKYNTSNGISVVEASDEGDGMPYWNSVDVGPTFTTKAIDFIDQHHQENLTNSTAIPFFLYYAAEAVHVPHSPPIDFLGTAIAGTTQVPTTKNSWTGYSLHSDMLYEIDVSFGMILDSLEARGILNNTIVIFTSDNGGLKDSVTGTSFSNQPLNGYKSTAAEGGHRVPMIVRWGDGTAVGSHISPNTAADQMVNIMDLYTTLADIVSVEVASDQALDSVSMRSIWLEGSSDTIQKQRLGYGGGAYYVRDSDWKYTESGTYAGLYNLATDLDESDDQSAIETQRLSDMQALLTSLKNDANGAVRTTPAPALPPTREVLSDDDGDGMEDSWERKFFGTTQGLNGNALDDIDQDQLNNLLEYALGGNPTDPSDASDLLPELLNTATGVDFKYMRRLDASSLGLQYTVEHTTDLSQPWDSVQFNETSAVDQGNGLEAVTEHYIGPTTDELFMRLNVSP